MPAGPSPGAWSRRQTPPSLPKPPPALDGICEGREAPFTKKDTCPWWQFDVEHDDGGIGKVTGGDRIDGLLGCAFPDSGGKYWKALYLIHERARR